MRHCILLFLSVSSVILFAAVGCSKPESQESESDEVADSVEERVLLLTFQANAATRLDESFASRDEWDLLSLRGSPVDDSVIESLPVRHDIEKLDLSQTLVTQASIELLPEKFPNLRILICDLTEVSSPSPLLKLAQIETISFFGTFAETQEAIRPDGAEVDFVARKTDQKTLDAIQSLASYGIFVGPVIVDETSIVAEKLTDQEFPKEHLDVTAMDQISAAASPLYREWDANPTALGVIKDIQFPVNLTLSTPFFEEVEKSEPFLDECLRALSGCKNIIGFSIIGGYIDVVQWARFIDTLRVKMSIMTGVRDFGKDSQSVADSLKSLDSLLVIDMAYFPISEIAVSDLMLCPSLRVLQLRGDRLEEQELAPFADHPTLETIILSTGTLSPEAEKQFTDRGIEVLH